MAFCRDGVKLLNTRDRWVYRDRTKAQDNAERRSAPVSVRSLCHSFTVSPSLLHSHSLTPSLCHSITLLLSLHHSFTIAPSLSLLHSITPSLSVVTSSLLHSVTSGLWWTCDCDVCVCCVSECISPCGRHFLLLALRLFVLLLCSDSQVLLFTLLIYSPFLDSSSDSRCLHTDRRWQIIHHESINWSSFWPSCLSERVWFVFGSDCVFVFLFCC